MMRPTNQSVVCPILVGRDAFVSSLTQRLQEVRVGQCQAILISGEAGIGKSRLVTEARSHANKQGFACVQGTCFEPDRTLPYAPFVDLLRAFCATHTRPEIIQPFGSNVAAQRQTAGLLLNFLPELAEAFPDLQPTAMFEPDQDKRRVFQSFLSFVTRLMVGSPNGLAGSLCIIIEDLHWCDDSSLELALHLVRRLSARPVLFVMTYRPDEARSHPGLQQLLIELDRMRLVTDHPLSGLALTEVAIMIRAIFGQAQPVRAEFVDAIYDLTDGNPFFIEETLKSLVSSGEIYRTAQGWARKPMNKLSIPRTWQDAVQRRTHNLSQNAAKVLTLAAVAGRRFNFPLLQRLTQYPDSELILYIKELTSAQLVTEEAPDMFSFRHALSREAIYTSLLTRERQHLHFAVAQAMEQIFASLLDVRSGDLAYHFFEANVWGKALAFAKRAGERATRLYAPRTAIVHYTRAITAAQMLSAKLPLSDLFRARGRAYETLGEFEPARDDYECALDAARGTQEQRDEWESLLALGFLWAGHDMNLAGDFFSKALAQAETMSDAAILGHSLNRLGNWHMMCEQPLEARRSHEKALALFESVQDRSGLASTFDLLGTTCISGGEHTAGAGYYGRAIALFRELGDRHGTASALTMSALICGQYLANTAYAAQANTLQACIQQAEEARTIAIEVGWRSAEALALVCLGAALSASGQYGRALASMQAGLEIANEIEHLQWQIDANLNLGGLWQDVLDWPAARQCFESALTTSIAVESMYWRRTAVGFLASTLVSIGELREAAAILDTISMPETEIYTMGEQHSWVAKAELLLALGQPVTALEIVERLMTASPEVQRGGGIPRLALLQGECLLRLEKTDEAEAAFVEGRQAALKQGLLNWQWRARAALARLYQVKGRAEMVIESNEGKRVVEALADTLSNPSIQNNFISKANAQFPPAPIVSPRQAAKMAYSGLTGREREVAARVAQGKTNRIISEELVVSERTIEKHIENIMAKLGFESRTQIAVWAVEKKLTG